MRECVPGSVRRWIERVCLRCGLGLQGEGKQNPQDNQIDGNARGGGFSHRASIISGSSNWFIFAMMRAGRSDRLFEISRLMRFEQARTHRYRRHQQL